MLRKWEAVGVVMYEWRVWSLICMNCSVMCVVFNGWYFVILRFFYWVLKYKNIFSDIQLLYLTLILLNQKSENFKNLFLNSDSKKHTSKHKGQKLMPMSSLLTYLKAFICNRLFLIQMSYTCGFKNYGFLLFYLLSYWCNINDLFLCPIWNEMKRGQINYDFLWCHSKCKKILLFYGILFLLWRFCEF